MGGHEFTIILLLLICTPQFPEEQQTCYDIASIRFPSENWIQKKYFLEIWVENNNKPLTQEQYVM